MTLTALQLDALSEVSHIGAGNAATALSQFLNKKVDLAPPRVMLSPVRQALKESSPASEENISVVILEALGQVFGHILVVFSEADAVSLVHLLLGKDFSEGDSGSELGRSALREMGTVMAGSYLRVLGQTSSLEFRLTAPRFVVDSTEGISSLLSSERVAVEETAICIQSEMSVADSPAVLTTLIFIPSPQSLDLLLKKLGMAAD